MKQYRSIFIFLTGLLIGVLATAAGFHLAKKPALTEEFARQGVTRDNNSRLEIVGDESSRTVGKKIVTKDRTTIDFIWTRCIDFAPAYEHWVSSGYRCLNFYTSSSSEKPAATLYVNETGYSFLINSKHTYMCNGLEQVLMEYLSDKTAGSGEKQNKTESQVAKR
jgi:hypothetical protein